jgi:diguanylate cyclase (GGDEF)-like protein/PAS domain S-box-containing protein
LSLRANTYVALTGAVFIAIALVFAATIYAGRSMVHGTERNLAMTEMRQVAREISAELRSIDTVAHDWGSWDDAVRFVTGKEPQFIADNVPAATLQQLDCDAVFVIDLHGSRLLEAYSPKLANDPKAMAALRTALIPGGKLLARQGGSAKIGASGIVGSGREAILVASRPVVSGAETGPIYGTVVFARLLDKTVLQHIGTVSDVALSAMPPGDPSISPETRQELFEQGGSTPIAISVQRPLEITAYLRVDGIDGRPALVLSSAIMPADYDMAMRTISTLVGVFLVGGMVWALIAFWVVDNTSLSRLTWLRDSMSLIAQGGALSARISVPPGERNEVTTVAAEVNAMLDALGISHERVRESEEQHRVLVENMADAVFTLTPDGIFTFGNPQAELLTGIPREELVGLPYDTVLSTESAKLVADRLGHLPSMGGRSVAVAFVDREGQSLPVELSISPVRDTDGNPVATTWIARDVTERREFEDKLMYLASHDHLTGLFNRRRFEEEVSQHLLGTKRRGDGGALLWLDLDNFKEVNDSFGHRVGDELLTHVASVLRDRSRDDQVLARLGGDEFAMLLPGADDEEAINAAERVLRELAVIPVQAQGSHPVRVTASAGVALYPAHASSVDELLLLADTAMYNAKEGGRNRVCLYSPDEAWPERIVVRREWAERIESALQSDSFVAYAQPILDLRSGLVTSFELLVRMVGADGSVILPGDFLPVAEDLGLITQIDRLMVRRAMSLAADPIVSASGVKLFVNLSAKTIAEESFSSFIRDQFDDSRINPNQLGFELTETALVANMARAHELIAQLRDLGCSFALDDFGTGFSSITYLRHMPVDVLKIDGGLVREMLVSEQDRHLVYAIVELARCLEISVTAEFVENGELLTLLKESGADYAQGYYIGKPLPAADVLLGVPTTEEVGAE